MEIRDIIKKAYNKYACLQKEDFYIEYDEQHNIIVLSWHVYMDRFINLNRVMQVAKFLRKYTDIPIYNSFGLMKI